MKSKERLYAVYNAMRSRCCNVKNCQYHLYGGRGIKVCDKWLNDYFAFKEWSLKNGYDENAPRGKLTLDRIDSNGNYEPSNCRWVDTKVQARNKRTTRLIEYGEEKICVRDFVRKLNICETTVLKMLNNGSSIEEILDKCCKN